MATPLLTAALTLPKIVLPRLAINITVPSFTVPVADTVLAAFGPERIMAGSDWPVCLLAADYPSVLRLAQSLVASLSPAEQTAVFKSTAARVYGISYPADATAR